MILETLKSLGLVDESRLEIISHGVRDRSDINVMRCKKSGLLFLHSTDHMNIEYYENQHDLGYWNTSARREALNQTYRDDSRRATRIRDAVTNKTWVDFGSGMAGSIEILRGFPAQAIAIEPQNTARQALKAAGIDARKEFGEVADGSADMITMFHVFEHLVDPLSVLTQALAKLRPGGTIIIEVPSANDSLIKMYKSPAFMKATFWSEHLVLYTPEVLRFLVEQSGFAEPVVEHLQRYSLANHLGWLVDGAPGGDSRFDFLNSTVLVEAYAQALAKIGCTDTLWLTATKHKG